MNTKETNMNKETTNKTSVRKWNKPTMQAILTQIRQAIKNGVNLKIVSNPDDMIRYTVIGYDSKGNEKIVLEAMNGRFDYLVTFDNRLFSKAN